MRKIKRKAKSSFPSFSSNLNWGSRAFTCWWWSLWDLCALPGLLLLLAIYCRSSRDALKFMIIQEWKTWRTVGCPLWPYISSPPAPGHLGSVRRKNFMRGVTFLWIADFLGEEEQFWSQHCETFFWFQIGGWTKMTADESCEKTICEQRLLSEDKLSKSITAGTIAKNSSRSGLINFNFCYVSFDLQIKLF